MAVYGIKPENRITDSADNPVASGQLHVFLAGTTTLATIYSDEGLTNAIANPIIADAEGFIAPFFVKNEKLKFRKTLADGTTTIGNEVDNVDYTVATSTSSEVDYAALRLHSGSGPVFLTKSGISGLFVADAADTTSADNGATIIVTTGGTRYKRSINGDYMLSWWEPNAVDARTELQAAIDLAATDGKFLDFQGLTPKVTTTQTKIDVDGTANVECGIVFPESKTTKIRGLSIDFSGLPTATPPIGIYVRGVAWPTGHALTANSVWPATTLTVSTTDAANYSAGDWIMIRSTKTWDAGLTLHGEFKEVSAVDTGTGIITIIGYLSGIYNTADTAKIYKFDTTTSYEIDGDAYLKGGGSASTVTLFECGRVFGAKANKITFENGGRRGIRFVNSIHGTVGDLQCNRIDEDGWGYGISCIGSAYITSGNVNGHEVRHGVTQGRNASNSLAGSAMPNRYFKTGDIHVENARDALLDSHNGSTNFTHGNVSGSMKLGNGSDDAVVFESAHGQVGNINVENSIRTQLIVQSVGNGDPGVRQALNTGHISGNTISTSTQPCMILENIDTNENDPIAINIASFSGVYARGMTGKPTNGNIDISIGGYNADIGANDGNVMETNATYRANLTITGAINGTHASITSTHYLFHAQGNSIIYLNGPGEISNTSGGGSPVRAANTSKIYRHPGLKITSQVVNFKTINGGFSDVYDMVLTSSRDGGVALDGGFMGDFVNGTTTGSTQYNGFASNRTGAGTYQITFDDRMPSDKYNPIVSLTGNGHHTLGSRTTTGVLIETYNNNTTPIKTDLSFVISFLPFPLIQ